MVKKGDCVKSLTPYGKSIKINECLIIESVFTLYSPINGSTTFYTFKNIRGFYNEIFFKIITNTELRELKINTLLKINKYE